MMMQIILISILAGLSSASWGAYKDSPYESFSRWSFLRSLIVAPIVSVIALNILYVFSVEKVHLVPFFFIIVGGERAITELLKAFLRNEDQSKYKIPSRFHFFGTVVNSQSIRLITLVVYVAYILLLIYLASVLSFDFGNDFFNDAIFGFAVGILGPALGGMYKDAPIESFEPIKFWRSPFMAMCASIVVGVFTDSNVILLMATVGGERTFTEFYKTFIYKKVPGKFRAKSPEFTEWLEKRKIFRITYAISLIGIILAYAFEEVSVQDYIVK